MTRKVLVAFLGGTSPDPSTLANLVDPFRLGMRELGYVEGQNLTIEFRWAEGQPKRLPGLLAELIQIHPDVLVTSGPAPALAAKEAPSSLAVVAVAVDDPVQMGLADSFAHPGRNITGVSAAFTGILPRRLQLLKDVVPTARQLAVLYNPATMPQASLASEVAQYERNLGVSITIREARTPEDFDVAFETMAKDRVDAVAILADATFWTHRGRLAELCFKFRLPSIWGHKSYLDAGGLMSYQGDFSAMFRRSAALVDKILKGDKPGDIAFEQATKLDLVVNLKAAKILGITIPQMVLLSADEVIR